MRMVMEMIMEIFDGADHGDDLICCHGDDHGHDHGDDHGDDHGSDGDHLVQLGLLHVSLAPAHLLEVEQNHLQE